MYFEKLKIASEYFWATVYFEGSCNLCTSEKLQYCWIDPIEATMYYPDYPI